jgi:hypothetical protein
MIFSGAPLLKGNLGSGVNRMINRRMLLSAINDAALMGARDIATESSLNVMETVLSGSAAFYLK